MPTSIGWQDREGAETSSEQFTRWDPVDQLQTEEDMAMYLDACFVEDPGDGSVVRAVLNDIARAQGIPQPAKAPVQLAELTTLTALPDEAINYSDIPASTPAEWRQAQIGRFYRPIERLTVHGCVTSVSRVKNVAR